MSRRRIAARRTTALREAKNYGLRGWISTRSSDLAQVLLEYVPRPFVRGRIVQHFPPSGGMLWVLSRERERHEDVEGPNGPAVAGIWGGRRCAGGLRGGVRRIGAAGAVGI